MMNKTKTVPGLEKVKQTVANSRCRRQELALASLQQKKSLSNWSEKTALEAFNS